MEQAAQTKPCPLCGSSLPYDKWLKVVGVYETQQKYLKDKEAELHKAKDQTLKLKEEYKKYRLKEKELKAQYAIKMKEDRKKVREVLANYRVKEQRVKSEVEEKYRIRQERVREKYEKDKQRALNAVRNEGIKIGSQKEKGRVENLRNVIDDLKQRRASDEERLKLRYQKGQESITRKLERQRLRDLRLAKSEATKAGIEKQKARTEKVSQMAEKLRKERNDSMERVKQLEEMMKKGTTPQIEGLDFERELADQLKSRFPDDEIELTGHKGDIIQTVKAETKKVGKIIYECKKTKDFQNKFLEQIRRDKARAVADYGVIVTWATKEGRPGFWVEGDIIVVHPHGALDIAVVLRETLVQMYTLKLSKSEYETKGKAILEFMQSEEFRTRIQDSIAKCREAYEILKKEYKTHINTWRKRKEIYESIFRNTGVIQNTVRYVLLHGKIPAKLPEAKEFPALPLSITEEKPPSQQ